MSQRLFIAIELPQEIKDQITAICGDMHGIKWTRPEGMHLTLQFIGGKSEEEKKGICKLLDKIESKSFALKLKNVGHFGNRGKARVLWIGVEENETLLMLQERISTSLTSANYIEPESRAFSPHTTLARPKNLPLSQIQPFLDKNKAFEVEPFTVGSFHLFSSKTTSKGAIYTKEKSF